MSRALNPLPSLIRASAFDAANAQMRKACRKAWSDADADPATETQERLIRSCYGRPGDNQPDMCYIRFGVAERLERAGRSNPEALEWFADNHAKIRRALSPAPSPQAGGEIPRIKDNDAGEITASLSGKEIRGWSYADDAERRVKMLMAREYVEGWYQATENANAG